MRQPWSKAGSEPALSDVLADPIVLKLMKADRLTPGDVLRATFGKIPRIEEPQRLSA
jgi:hypothetical protein